MTGSGTNDGATDHAIERNSPASSIQLKPLGARLLIVLLSITVSAGPVIKVVTIAMSRRP